jgi:hypothetical protein
MASYHAAKPSGLPAIFGPSTPDPYQPSAGVKYTMQDGFKYAAVGGVAFSAGVHVGGLLADLASYIKSK